MHPAKRPPLWVRALSLFTALCVPLATAPVLPAAVVYLDVNGTTAGSGVTQGATVLWDTSALWNSVSNGSGATAAWAAGDVATFSAGTDALGAAYTVQISGSQSVGGLVFEEGYVTLSGGTLALAGNADVSVASPLTATISATIDDGASDFNLTKLGTGTLVLSGTNTYSGKTLINAGVLSISQDVNLGAAPAGVTADAMTFGGGTLQITGTANPTLNANRGITFGAGVTGTLQVVDAGNTVIYGGQITGAAGTAFKKTGAGTLDLQGSSNATLGGALQVDGGTLRLSGGGALTGLSGVTISNRGILTLDNTGTNSGDRIAGAITSSGGTLNFVANAAATTEILGALTLNAGALTLNSTAGAGGSAVTLPTLTRSVAGGTLYLNGAGLGSATNQVVLGTAPALVNSVLKYGVVNNGTLASFATYPTSGGTDQSVAPLTLAAHNQGAETTWAAANNVRPTADVTVTAARSLYTLTLDSGIDLLGPAGDRTINIGGAVLQTGGVSVVAANGTNEHVLAFGTNEALFITLGSLQLDRGNTNSLTGTGGFTKSGAGTLILNGVSTLTAATGAFNVNEGILEMRGSTSLMTTAATINLNGANLRLSNDANTTYVGNLAVNADSLITVDRVTAAATATTHTLGTLTLAGGRTLSVNSNDITAGTAYGVTFNGPFTLGGPATIDVANNGTGTGTMTVGTVSGAFLLTKTGAGDLVLNNVSTGVFSAPVDIQGGRVGWSPGSNTLTDNTVFSGVGGLIKTGNGIVVITGASTFTGGVTVNGGTLSFSTVSDNGGTASNLGMGSNGISLGGGTLSFIGSASQSTNRAITTTAASTLNASGTGGATITYTGAITPGVDFNVTLTGTGAAFITGGLTMPVGTGAADLLVNSGTWTFSGTPMSIADDIIVTGGTAVLNLNTTGVLTGTGTSNGLYARSDAVINLNAQDVNGAANSGGLDLILIGDTGAGILNTNGFNITTPRLDLGDDDTLVDTGNITGTGTVTVTADFNLFRGSISANLAGPIAIQKLGIGTVTLSGDNSGLTTSANFTEVSAGTLILDYTTSNTSKVTTTNSIDMRGGTLVINGNATADTTQTVAGLTLANFGASTIAVNSGAADKGATLVLNAITRAAGAGAVRFNLSGLGAVTTTNANLASGILGGWATIRDASGQTNFAANNGSGTLVAIAPTTRNNLGTWVAGEHLTDDTTGFTDTLGGTTGINSLRFNAAGPSTVALPDGTVLGIASGGVLQTSSVTGGASLITGGRLVSATGSELIFTTDSATQMLTVASAIGGAHAITKSGNGTLRLSGTNTNTGTTRLLSGTLQLSGGNAVGDSSAVALGATQANVLELLNSEAFGSLSGGTNANLITAELRLNGNALNVTQTTSGTYAGLLTGTAASSFTKTGAANLQFSTSANPDFLGTVTVNGGLFYISVSTSLLGVPSFTVNKGGSFMIDNNGTTTLSDRLGAAATIILNSADGAWSGETRPSGLSTRRDQGSGQSETFGVLTLNSGASYTRLDGTATNSVATLITDNIVRANKATLDVRGTNLSATSGARGQLRIGTAGNQTTFINAMVGGGSTTLGTKNISIVPWAIGEEHAGGLGDLNMGNSLMTYVSGASFRALNLTTEYNTFATKTTNQDNIRESRTTDLTGLTTQTLNGLVLHNNNTAASIIEVLGTGAGQSLAVTSGALLFTLNTTFTASASSSTVLGGFDSGISVGSTNEYVIHVVNPSSVATTATLTAAITSPLTSAADITKSGRGTLVLTGNNTAGGGTGWTTTINEGILQISDLDNIGGNTGALVFAGGTLRLAAAGSIAGTVPINISAYSGDDLSLRTLSFLNGGGTLDTNGFDLTLANGLGGGTGTFTKTGAGNLALNAATTLTGGTNLSGGTLTLGASQAIGTGVLAVSGASTLALGANNATVAGLTMNNAVNVISGSGTLTVNGDAIVSRGTIAPLLAGSMNLTKQTATQVVALSNAANTFTGYTHVQDGVLSVTGLANAGVASSLGAPTGENSVIRLGNTTTTGTLNYLGGATSTNRIISLAGTTGGGIVDNDGTGALTLTGDITGNDYGAKTLTLQGATTGFSNVFSGVISDGLGTVALTKAEAGTWVLTQAQRYTGINTLTLGTLQVSTATGGLGNATAANTINLNGGTLSFRNDGAGSNGTIIFGSAANPSGYNVTHSASSTINVDNLTANTGNTVVLGPIVQGSVGARSLTVTGGNGYILSVPSFGLSGGTGQTTTLIPTTASLVITGNVTNPMSGFTASNFDTVVLDGTSTGNAINGSISDAAGASIAAGGTTRVTKSNTSTWTLNGVSTYTGVTSVSGGTLQVTQATNGLGNSVAANAIALSGGTLSLLNNGGGNNGTIIYGSTDNAAGYNVTVTASSTINVDQLTANTGNTVQLNNLTIGAQTLTVTGAHGYNLAFAGTGTTVTGAAVLNPTTATLTVGPVALTAGQTLTLSGATTGNSIGAITSTTGALTKAGTSTWTLNAVNTYTGVTSINQGTLISAVDLNMTGGLNFGSANSITTAGTLDLTNTNATFAGAMLVQTNTASASTVTIGAGKSLTINNTATFGSAAGNSTTQFTATGAGTFNVTNTTVGNGFLVGNTANTNVTTADFSGLATMNVSLNPTGGILQVSNTSGTNATGYATLILANTSTITASALTIGGGGSYNGNTGQVNVLKLGSGLNTLNVDAVNVGTGSRDLGAVSFNNPASGSVVIRAANGTGRAAFNMATGSATTGVLFNGNQNGFDVSGHNADLLFSAMTIGTQNRAADLFNVFSFDQGTLNAQSLTMSTRASNAFNTTSIMNLGGTGMVTIGTGAGTAVTLATNSGAGSAVATLNITGTAAVTLTGDLVRGANTGTGTATGTLNLQGGSLDMSGFAIGSGTAAIVLNLESGTLSNLAQLNGGAAVNKVTAGTLNFGGASAFTGPLNVQEGRVALLGGGNNRIAATAAVTLGSGAVSGVLQLGNVAGKSDQTLSSLLTAGTGTANAVVGGSSQLSTLTLDHAGTMNFSGSFGGLTGNDGNLSLVKAGAGALTLSGVNRINGSVTVSQGVLNAGFGTGGVTAISVASGAAFNLSNLTTETLTLAGTGTVLTLGAGSTLGFEIGTVVDQIIGSGLGSSALVTGAVNIDLFSLGGLNAGTYTLIQMPGGGLLNTHGSTGSYLINSAPGGFQFSLNASDTLLQLVVSSVNIPTMYWRNGLGDNSWSSLSGGNTNWTTDLDGTLNAHATPSATTDVIFSATTAPLTGTAISTTLDGSFSMKTLSFTSAPAGVTSVEVQTGTPNTSTLTFTPVDPATGVDVADNAGAVTIFPSVILGANQAWSVAGTGANGSSLTVLGNVSGSGFSLTKTGAGTLILGGTNTYGATEISAGVLQIGNGGITGTLGSGAVVNNGSLVFNHGAGANVVMANVISGSGGITKTGAGTVTLSSTTNSYTGKTIINGGTLKITAEASLGTNPASATADQLTLSGGGTLGMTADLTIDDANRGITLGAGGGVFSPDAGVTATVNKIITGAGSLGKTGGGTLVLGAANSFTGGVVIDAGTLQVNVSQVLTGGLTFGLPLGSTNAGTLDLSSASASFSGGLVVQSNNATPHTVTIGSGQTLSLGGNVVVGAVTPLVTNATARLTMNGGGALSVTTAAGGLFQVGATTSTTISQSSTLDLSGLSSVTINVSATGTVRVNQPSGTNLAGNQSALLLPTPTVGILPTTPVTTITAGNFNVGDNGGNGGAVGQVNSVVFGTGLTTLNVNTVNVGTGGRDFGTLTFATADGTLRLRGANGTGRTNFNIGTGTANTGVGAGTGVTNNVNFSGHSVDLLIGTLTMGSQNRNSGRTDTFTFDTGILDITTVIIGTNLGTANSTAASSTWASTLNLGGGSTIIGTGGMDLGIGALAVTGTDIINATVNISGGTVTVANNTTLGAAIRLGHNNVATGLTANGTVNLTGGSLTVSGNIIRGSTTGAGSATVTLNGAGAVLDLGGSGTASSIGSATNTVTFNMQQGTLRNLGEFNGGAALVKTGTGTVILDNTGGMTNTYTGVTTISGGTLQVGSGGTTGTLGTAGVTNNATLSFNRSDVHTVTNVISGTGAVTQVGSGTTVLGVVNNYTGATTVSAGTLLVGTNAITTAATGAGDVSVASGGTLGGTGTISFLGKTTTILGGGVLSPGDSTAVGADTLGRLNIAGNLTTVAGGSAGGQIQLGIFNPTTSDAAFAAALEASGNTLTALAYFTGASGGVQDTWNAAQAVGAHNHDFLSISGTLTLTHGASGLPTIGVTSSGYVNHQIGDVFNLLDWSTALATKDSTSMGAFTPGSVLDLLLPVLDNGYVWDTSLFASKGIIVVVPEPSRVMLLFTCLLGLALRRRRR